MNLSPNQQKPKKVTQTTSQVFFAFIALISCGIIVGIISSLSAILFVESIRFLNDLLFVSTRTRNSFQSAPWFPFVAILIPTLGGLIVGYICLTIKNKKALGLSDSIRIAHTYNSSLPFVDGMKSTLAAIVSIGSGASLGQYGPLVALGSTLGNLYKRTFGLYLSLNIGIGCGAASAIATAFNAPLAGLVFAHEVILRHYSFRSFAPIIIAATTGYIISHNILERPPLLEVTLLTNILTIEYAVFILIGIGGALIATVFVRLVLWLSEQSKNIKIHAPFKTALAGALLGAVGLFIPEILGTSNAALHLAVVPDGFESERLILILVAKILLTALCLGFGFVGGVFNPSIVIGVMFGALVGNNIELLLGIFHAPVAVYAICGMVAVTSPVIGAPLSTILIIFELTRHYEIATATLLTVAFSNLIAYRLFGRSLFDIQLFKQGFDLSWGRDKILLSQKSIKNYIHTEVETYSADAKTREVLQGLIKNNETEAYIIGDKDEYVGTITLNRFVQEPNLLYDDEKCAGEIAQKEVLIFDDATSIWSAMAKMQSFVGESIPVVSAMPNSEKEHSFIGIVYETSIINAYLHTMDDIRDEEKAGL